VAVVFAHVQDPLSFMAADPEPVRIGNISLTPEGVGSTWESWWHVAGVPMHATWTRKVYVPDERIVDHTSTGMTWTFVTQPDATGTTLTIGYAITTRLGTANWILDHAFGNQDRQLDAMLANFKAAIQAPQGSGNQETGPAPGALAGQRRPIRTWLGAPLDWVGAKLMPLSHAGVYQGVADALGLGPDDDLLDIGCGPGAFLALHAGTVARVTGLDTSQVMLHEAHARLADRVDAGTARLVHADSAQLPFADAEFTAVTAITAPVNLAEVFRVLRPDGRFVVDELPADPRKTSAQRTGTLWKLAEADTCAVVRDAGFADLAVSYRGAARITDNRIISCRKPV
jgi:SAM-dependent methyltransferase